MRTSQIALEHDALVKATLNGQTKSTSTHIKHSWQRCLEDFGLDPKDVTDPHVLTTDELRVREDRLRDLIDIAEFEMQTLFQQVSGHEEHAVILTDHDGIILRCLRESGFDSAARRDGLSVGGIWSEAHQGTNGMGTCLVEKCPVVIHREEHFLARNTALTCSAFPIMTPDGDLLGVLDASSATNRAHQHTLSLVSMAVQFIENRLFMKQHEECFVLRFHSRAEFVTTSGEGKIAISGDGRIINANRTALAQLGYEHVGDLRGHSVDDVFETEMEELCHGPRLHGLHPQPLREISNGRLVFAVVQRPRALEEARHGELVNLAGQPVTSAHAAVGQPVAEATGHASQASTQSQPQVKADSAAGFDSLEAMHFNDPTMAHNIHCARRILEEDIPLLLQGETGTGKEVFSQAVHDTSSRAGQPFVAVNCASIPDTLIESELFGYQAGAFTGANRKGQRGKILEADGGTLFLDEIGDMPIALQARLLRVLETREVLPLGGSTAVKVDIRIISATNRSLRELMRQGLFREDLYYRLNGLTLALPSLRERTDKRRLIAELVKREMPASRHVEVDPAAMQMLYHYDWPGNMRQLRFALRTALVLADDVMRPEHLPMEVRQGSATLDSCGDEIDNPSKSNPLEAAERVALLELLERYHHNISQVARHLSVCRNTLYRKMRRHNIRLPNG